MREIPCTRMDEHKDAYWHWREMIGRGYLPERGNYLLHIDHHADMETGGYDWDMTQMPDTPKEAFRFTEQCLGIADFIMPAMWQGIFSTLHFVKNLYPVKMREKEQFLIWNPGTGLVMGDYVPFLHGGVKKEQQTCYRFFTLRENGLNTEEDVKDAVHIVLDVDLDYFCWDDSLKSVPEKKIEITAEACEAFLRDRNHPFRILPKRLLHVKEEGGRFFLVYEENIERNKLPEERLIEKRMDRLFDWIERCRIVPDTIDVCRSCYSGYLPAERAAFTEETFMKKLKEVFPVREILL